MERNEFLKAITVKHEEIELASLNNAKVTIKEPTIAESQKIEAVRQKVLKGEATNEDLIIEACRCAMVKPAYFTDEELKNLSLSGMGIFTEIYMKLPKIGMTQEQKDEYDKRLIENFNKTLSNALSKEEVQKKSNKKKDSSSN